MNTLELLDPTRPNDPAFDPRGAQADRVRAAARAGAPRRDLPPRRRRRAASRRIAAGVLAIAAVVAAVVVATDTTAPTDARAALARAAARTADITSGRIVWTVGGEDPRSGYAGRTRTVVRFDGENLEARSRSRATVPGRPVMETDTTLRHVDGTAYVRDESQPGADFERIGRAAPTDPSRLLVEQVGSPALVELARRDPGLERSAAPGGGTLYQATATAGEVFDAAPIAAGRAQGEVFDRKVRLEVIVRDGLVRRVKVVDEGITQTTEYLELGEPQPIERP